MSYFNAFTLVLKSKADWLILLERENEECMATIDKNIKGLNDVQLSLLRMFNRNMSYEETVEIRDLLTKYYSQKLKDEVDNIVGKKKIADSEYDKLRS